MTPISHTDLSLCVATINKLLSRCGYSHTISSISQCSPSLFVLLFEGLFHFRLPNIHREKKQTSVEKLHNMQQLITTMEWTAGFPLSHISAKGILNGDPKHLCLLIQIFKELIIIVDTQHRKGLEQARPPTPIPRQLDEEEEDDEHVHSRSDEVSQWCDTVLRESNFTENIREVVALNPDYHIPSSSRSSDFSTPVQLLSLSHPPRKDPTKPNESQTAAKEREALLHPQPQSASTLHPFPTSLDAIAAIRQAHLSPHAFLPTTKSGIPDKEATTTIPGLSPIPGVSPIPMLPDQFATHLPHAGMHQIHGSDPDSSQSLRYHGFYSQPYPHPALLVAHDLPPSVQVPQSELLPCLEDDKKTPQEAPVSAQSPPGSAPTKDEAQIKVQEKCRKKPPKAEQDGSHLVPSMPVDAETPKEPTLQHQAPGKHYKPQDGAKRNEKDEKDANAVEDSSEVAQKRTSQRRLIGDEKRDMLRARRFLESQQQKILASATEKRGVEQAALLKVFRLLLKRERGRLVEEKARLKQGQKEAQKERFRQQSALEHYYMSQHTMLQEELKHFQECKRMQDKQQRLALYQLRRETRDQQLRGLEQYYQKLRSEDEARFHRYSLETLLKRFGFAG